MEFVADLHIHSHYARATSGDLNFTELYRWAGYKGVQVVGTGDFTHGGWIAEMEECLVPAAESGLYCLRPDLAKTVAGQMPSGCQQPVRFLMTAEISSIYKKNGKTRKVHNIVCAPDLETVKKIRLELAKIGNLDSDGRPILGLDCRNLLEILLHISPDIYLIPAHIWTPWFSVLGAQSGFDDIEECFGDLTPHIFAVETGLSSDPAMNWLCSRLDRFTLVSNSDAHSAAKLAREANLFNTDLSYPALFAALKTADPKQFLGTIEFYPEEGKYHLDGHRNCEVRWTPEESQRHNNVCPVCGKTITIGVMHRVAELADRKPGVKPPRAANYQNLVPLETILAEVLAVGPASKKVGEMYRKLLCQYGSELNILRHVPVTDLDQNQFGLLAEAIQRVRQGNLDIQAGYDGEFGTIKLFTPDEREEFTTQANFFAGWGEEKTKAEKTKKTKANKTYRANRTDRAETATAKSPASPQDQLNAEQRSAVTYRGTPLWIVAGPGTGKTRTLTARIAHLVEQCQMPAQQILAITFTNKAAEEMAERLARLLGDRATPLTVCTCHRLGLAILKEHGERLGLVRNFSIAEPAELVAALPDPKEFPMAVLDAISLAKSRLLAPSNIEDMELRDKYRQYEITLRQHDAIDLDDLIVLPVKLLQEHADVRSIYQERWQAIAVDEYQDIAEAQQRLLELLLTPTTDLCVIGDPDQAIYGFRGASPQFFDDFGRRFPNAKKFALTCNYRSSEPIVTAASSLIAHNASHRDGQLTAMQIGGELIRSYAAPTAAAEAEFVVQTIEDLVGGTSHFSFVSNRVTAATQPENLSFQSFAILYRTTAQSKLLEEALARSGMPYQIVGGTSLWRHPTMRLWRTLLGIVAAPDHRFDLLYLIRELPGIGERTVAKLGEYAATHGVSLWQALLHGNEITTIAPNICQQLQSFGQMVQAWHNLSVVTDSSQVLQQIQSQLQTYPLSWQLSEDFWAILSQLAQRLPRLKEMGDYLAIQRQPDDLQLKAEKIKLMTLHAAKGLEFPVVFIVGCEDGLLPSLMAQREVGSGDADGSEEERRLMYVGMTRAQQLLYLTNSKQRLLLGKPEQRRPSPYLDELPSSLVCAVKSSWKPRKKPRSAEQQLSFF